MEVQRFNTVMIAFSYWQISHYHLTDFNLQFLSLLSVHTIDLVCLCLCVCMCLCVFVCLCYNRISAAVQLWKLLALV